MAISTAAAITFKAEVFGGIHDLDTDTLKVALYAEPAPISAGTTVYTVTGEVSGAGYTAGGATLSGVTITTSGSTSYLDFDNPIWTSATFVVDGGLIYNSSKANRAIMSFKLASQVNVNNADFELIVPVPGETTAVLRLT